MDATRYARYRRAVEAGLAAYRRRYFAGREALFEPGPRGQPVFRAASAHLNFFDPALYHALTWRPDAFRRLGEARVLAISVFGTLARREDLALLAEVRCDDGRPVLAQACESALALELQQRVALPERRTPLIVDLWLHAVAPAPKAGEAGPATANRSPLRQSAPHPTLSPPGRGEAMRAAPPDRLACTGGESHEGPPHRNVASESTPLPSEGEGRMKCHSDGDPRPRAGAARGGILAIHGRLLERELGPVARPAGGLRAAGRRGTVLVVYDARNPAFEPGRRCDRDLAALQADLSRGVRLRRTSWQAIAGAMARSPWYADLLDYLKAKYGIEPAG